MATNLPIEATCIPYHACHGLSAKTVLVLAPHPDDEVFGCAGALVHHLQAGCRIVVIVLSDGAFGAADQTDEVIAVREAESCAAAALLGYPDPDFWRLPDRGIICDKQLISRVIAAIQAADADLIYAPALSEIHPDHRATAMAAVEAVRHLGPGHRLAMYEIGIPLSPNVLVDISDQAHLKHQAMQCFVSQLKVQAYDKHIAALNCFRTYTLPKTVTMAEAYRLYEADQIPQETTPTAEPLECTLHQLKQHIQQIEHTLEEQSHQLAQANAAVKKMQNSTSWRVSSPVRLVGRLMLLMRSRTK